MCALAEGYREDLAYIHDAGFGHIARAAGPVLVDRLRRRRVSGGLVIDLGCGSGILSEIVAAAGFDVLGIDLSQALLAVARRRVPNGRFVVGSVLTAELPPCVAVAAVGEIVNFLFDPGNTREALARLLGRICGALAAGGPFLFDVAEPGRVPGPGPRMGHAEGEDWAVLWTAEEDRERGLLTRHITSFRKVGELYRRDHEVHRLRLMPRAEVAAQLRAAGFDVQILEAYGALPFPQGGPGSWHASPSAGSTLAVPNLIVIPCREGQSGCGGPTVRKSWQPYPDHPQVRELTELLADLQERAVQAAAARDFASAGRLTGERQAARERLEVLTAALLRDESLTPRWVAHTEADAAAGAVPCLECGNNIPAGKSRCAYCGWTYLAECGDRA